ncbi:MAG: hypothetical protein ACE5Z5_05490 [Candidatus Bathyarchaeia archaeon]
MMPEIRNAEQATDKALSFLREKYPSRARVARPARAFKEDGVWQIQLDLGIARVLIATLKIDAKTGEILEYSIPPF